MNRLTDRDAFTLMAANSGILTKVSGMFVYVGVPGPSGERMFHGYWFNADGSLSRIEVVPAWQAGA